MRKTHFIRVRFWEAQAILEGVKTSVIHHGDYADYEVGDTIRFEVVKNSGAGKVEHHPLSRQVYSITFKDRGYGLRDGFICLSLRRENRAGR